MSSTAHQTARSKVRTLPLLVAAVAFIAAMHIFIKTVKEAG